MKRISALVLVSACLVAGSSVAYAGVVPRTGTWAGSAQTTAYFEDGSQVNATEQALFELVKQRIQNLELQVVLACYNRETRDTYDVYYGPLKRESLGRLGSGLETTKRFTADDGSGRRANVTAQFDYRGSRAKLRIRVSWRGQVERCSGRTTLNLTRGPLLPPPAAS